MGQFVNSDQDANTETHTYWFIDCKACTLAASPCNNAALLALTLYLVLMNDR